MKVLANLRNKIDQGQVSRKQNMTEKQMMVENKRENTIRLKSVIHSVKTVSQFKQQQVQTSIELNQQKLKNADPMT